MDIATFNRAKQAYSAQSWDTAVILFSQCGTGPGTGEACHLCGNALMRLGRVQEAVQAYRAAAADPAYPNKGAVYTNLGKAQMFLGDYYGAVESLRTALEDGSYTGSYKAQIALGDAYMKLGDPRSAGVAYRKAALEGNNPDPAKSLINLGVCFMQLKRPADAAEAYRTALDFSRSDEERNVLNANLGQAYVASNRMIEAVAAFEAATSAGYALSPSAQADYARAQQATATLGRASGTRADSTDMFLRGFGGGFDPLDPSGRTGEVMPSPDQSGFFDIDESAIEKHMREVERNGRGSSHTGLKVFIVLLALLVAAGAGLFAAYMQGFGIPSQQAAVDSAFAAALQGNDAPQAWASDVSAATRSSKMSAVSGSSSYEVVGMDQSASSSTALVNVSLPEGARQTYKVDLVREGIAWKIANVDRVISSVDANTYASILGDTATQAAPTDQAVGQAADQPVDQAADQAQGQEGQPAADQAPEQQVGEGEAPLQ